jgi:DUF1365 family protein
MPTVNKIETLTSGLYEGEVRHQRFSPIKHDFLYKIFMVFINLNELDTLFDNFWFWSSRKPNVAYFKRADHLGESNIHLKDAVKNFVFQRTGYRVEGNIYILTHLRYWGYCFNPVSFYYCYDKNNQYVEWIIAEINNTPWGEQYCYLLKTASCFYNENSDQYITPEANQTSNHYIFNKNFHISPFMPMDLVNDWWIQSPKENLMIHMNNYYQEKKVFTAHLSMQRKEITHKNLAKILLSYPFMTGKVISGIYWEALKIKIKGAPFYSHPKNSS